MNHHIGRARNGAASDNVIGGAPRRPIDLGDLVRSPRLASRPLPPRAVLTTHRAPGATRPPADDVRLLVDVEPVSAFLSGELKFYSAAPSPRDNHRRRI